MSDSDTVIRVRDENKPDVPSLNKYLSRNGIQVNNASSLVFTESRSICSESVTPDRGVPSENNNARLATSPSSHHRKATEGSVIGVNGMTIPSVVCSEGTIQRDYVDTSSDLSRHCHTLSHSVLVFQRRRGGSVKKPTKGKRKCKKPPVPMDGNKTEMEKDDSEGDYVIRCICGYSDMYDKQIQCEKCEVWQHFACMGISPSSIPDCYLCEICDPMVYRPLRVEEAREIHRILMPREAQIGKFDKEARKDPGTLKRVQTIRRKRSVDGPPVVVTYPPRQIDLLIPEKKRTTIPSRQSSVEATSAPRTVHREDLCELSRDDRKILQYEQMFKKMEERRDRKDKRRRNPDNSSNGSPPPERGSTRERENVYESHGESTDAPPSPQLPNIIDIPPPLPLLNISGGTPPAETFMTPSGEQTPIRLLRRTKRIPGQKDAFVDKEKAGGSSSPSETENVSASNTPGTPNGTEKSRFSLRLRNIASTKCVESVPDNSRIELNCVKKRKKDKEGDLSMDEELIQTPVSPPLKRRIRALSFIDTYYSSMADIQSESETQKATRRNRAFSASEEYERAKVEHERIRLYQMYGMKKAVCARYNDDPTCKATSAILASPVFGESSRALPVSSGNTTECPAAISSVQKPRPPLSSLGDFSPLRRSKTVRVMIEESIKKNREHEEMYVKSQKIVEKGIPLVRVREVLTSRKLTESTELSSLQPLADVGLVTLTKLEPLQTETREPLLRPDLVSAVNTKEAPSTVSLSSSSRPSIVIALAKPAVKSQALMPVIRRTSEIQSALVEGKDVPMEKALDRSEKDASIPGEPTDAQPAGSSNDCELSTADANLSPHPPVTPKKLSLAEYRQRKLCTQGSSDSLLGISITSPLSSPAKSAETGSPSTSPTKTSDHTSTNPVGTSARPLSPHRTLQLKDPLDAPLIPPPIPQRTSVIQRIGIVPTTVPVVRTIQTVVACADESDSGNVAVKANGIPRPTEERQGSKIIKPPIENAGKGPSVPSHEPVRPCLAPFHVQSHFRPPPMLAPRSILDESR